MKTLKKLPTAAFALAALATSVAPAFAAEAFYTSPVTAPLLNQGGVVYTSADWTVDPLTAGKLITQVNYTVKYTVTKYSTSPYSLQVRVCLRTPTIVCTAYGPANVATNATATFAGKDASKAFYIQAMVNGTTTLLNPSPGASGNSMITVGYQ